MCTPNNFFKIIEVGKRELYEAEPLLGLEIEVSRGEGPY